MTPEPISKGDAVEIATGRRVRSYFLKHDAESGLFSPTEFRKRFKLG